MKGSGNAAFFREVWNAAEKPLAIAKTHLNRYGTGSL
jgi:hypothetical protein